MGKTRGQIETETWYMCTVDSPLGGIVITSDGEALKELWLEGQRQEAELKEKKYIEKELSVFTQTRLWLEEYFAGTIPGELPALSPEGSSFQRRVWELLLEIPYGETYTYGEIAKRIATERGIERMAAQAVGGAVGRNPISILIPCHRVVGKNGSLVGYTGGLEKKIALLEIEQGNRG